MATPSLSEPIDGDLSAYASADTKHWETTTIRQEPIASLSCGVGLADPEPQCQEPSELCEFVILEAAASWAEIYRWQAHDALDHDLRDSRQTIAWRRVDRHSRKRNRTLAEH